MWLCVTVCCNVLQCVEVKIQSLLQGSFAKETYNLAGIAWVGVGEDEERRARACGCVLQCVAMCCNVLQRVAVCGSVLQCVLEREKTWK